MRKNMSTQKKSVIARLFSAVRDAWRSYSRAVDMAYSRGHLHENNWDASLCTQGGSIPAPTKKRAIKADAFDHY